MKELKYKSQIHHNKNNKGIDYYIGDIQGHYKLLLKTLSERGFDFAHDRLFSVGDLVDKGPESESCLNLLKESWFFSVLGNHDFYFIEAVYSESFRKAYLKNYGAWAVEMFDDEQKVLNMASLMKLRMPLTRVVCDEIRIGVGHAAFTNENIFNKDVFTPKEVNLITSSRQMFDDPSSEIKGMDLVFLGHNSVEEMSKTNNIIWLDTIHTGVLSVVKWTEALNASQLKG